MTPFFDSPGRQQLLGVSAARWIKTPFILGAAVCGAGVDCVRFVASVLVECGHLDGYTFPAYSVDGGSHLDKSLVEAWLEGNPRFEPVPVSELMPGDVLAFRIGRGVSHHVGLYNGRPPGAIWSAMGNDGVQARTLRDPTWGRRLVRAWRPMELSQ